MDLNDIALKLKSYHWKNIKQHTTFKDYQFDLVAERMHLLVVRWYVLVKQVIVLDEKTLKTHLQIFKDISKKSKSIFIGKMFLYVIVAPKVDPALEPQIKGDNFEILINTWFTMTGSSPRPALFIGRIEGGGGNLLAYDTTARQWYGQIPEIPWDVKKYSEQIKEIIR